MCLEKRVGGGAEQGTEREGAVDGWECEKQIKRYRVGWGDEDGGSVNLNTN